MIERTARYRQPSAPSADATAKLGFSSLVRGAASWLSVVPVPARPITKPTAFDRGRIY